MNSTPLIWGNRYGAPHFNRVNTRPAMPVTEFEDTMPSMPAPLYGHTTGQHNHLPAPKVRRRRWGLLILAIVLVAFCAAPVLFFTR